MNKQNAILKSAVSVALFAMAGGAFAGSVTTPATDALATKYATEALTATTAVTLPTVVYSLGVSRAVGQNFTFIVTPSAGTSLDATTCTPAVWVGSAGLVTATKRASTTECALDVTVTAATAIGATITATGEKLTASPLNVAGSSVTLSISLKDPGETSFIDNSGSVSRVVATAVNAVNVFAAASDTLTVANVNDAAGPLRGFNVTNGTTGAAAGATPWDGDTAAVAAALLTFDNNSASAKDATGAANFDFTGAGGTSATVVLTDTASFSAAAANGVCLDVNNDGTFCAAGEIMAVAGTSATLTIAKAAFPAVGTTATKAVSYKANGTASLGTSRTFSLSGTITPAVGAAHALANTQAGGTGTGFNPTFWVWSANAIELWAPYFSTNAGFISRFVFQNTGPAAQYTATCVGETGNVVTHNAGSAGSLVSGTTSIDAASVCSFSGNTRGSVRFIINAPAGNVKGVYNLVNPSTLSPTIIGMERPYGFSTF